MLKGDYVVHKFTSSGVFEVSPDSSLTEVEVLVVAGGGGGGTSLGSGGGGGGVNHSQSLTVQKQAYAVTVGRRSIRGDKGRGCQRRRQLVRVSSGR